MAAARKYWLGGNPTKCDLCKQPIVDAFIDGNTTYGMWATMCPTCHSCHGRGLGPGFGQYYALEKDGKFYKVEGVMTAPYGKKYKLQPDGKYYKEV